MSRFLILFFAGSGLGALVGLLLGMSASPVVAAVLGAAVPFAVGFATWFSTKRAPNNTNTASTMSLYSVVVGGFAWAAVLFTGLGVAIRTHGWLSPSPAALVEQWKKAGFSDYEARAMVSGSLNPSSLAHTSEGEEKASPHPSVNLGNSVLFSGITQETIRDLTPMVENATLDSLKESFTRRGGFLKRAVDYTDGKHMDPSDQKQFLKDFFYIVSQSPPQ